MGCGCTVSSLTLLLTPTWGRFPEKVLADLSVTGQGDTVAGEGDPQRGTDLEGLPALLCRRCPDY